MINEQELLQIINGGESGKVQFKERLPHSDSLAHEIIAFSNSRGGTIIFGVNDKTGALNELSLAEIRQVNQQAVNVASHKVYPPVYLTSDTVSVKGNQIVVISVEEGISKPYKDSFEMTCEEKGLTLEQAHTQMIFQEFKNRLDAATTITFYTPE